MIKCLNCGKRIRSETKELCTVTCEKEWNNKINRKIDQLPDFEDFSETLTLDWDSFICAADFHIPFVSKEVLKSIMKEAKSRRIKKLVVGGDFLDLNSYSKFFSYTRIPWKVERDCAIEVLKILYKQFSEISFIIANHEIRYLKALSPEVQGDIKDLYRLIGVKDLSLVTLKNELRIGNWLVVHPAHARKTPLSIARDLSGIHKNVNIIVTHAHMQASGYDPSGKYYLIDLGLCADPHLVEYKNMKVTEHFSWNKGYLIVEDGIPELKEFK